MTREINLESLTKEVSLEILLRLRQAISYQLYRNKTIMSQSR